MKRLILSAVCLLTSLTANAAIINIDVDRTQYNLGEEVTATVSVSDLSDPFFGDIFVGAFDFILNYDASVVTTVPGSVEFSDNLGDGVLTSAQFSLDDGFGGLAVNEVSFVFDLFTLQDLSVPVELFSVTFLATSTGIAGFDLAAGLSPDLLADGLGLGIPVTDVQSDSFEVNAPATLGMLLMAGGLLVMRRRA